MNAPAVLRSLLRVLPTRTEAPPRAVARRHQARAVVLLGAAFILLAMVAMAVAVETVKPQWRDPEYGHRLRQLKQLRAAHPQRPLVVAVGSSRTQMGLSPAAMNLPDEPGSPLVYNFGQAGAGPLQSLLTVLRLLDAGVKPDFLLVELFPAALAADGPAEAAFAHILPRLSLADVQRLEPYCADVQTLRHGWAKRRANSWYEHRISLMSHWQPGWLPWQHRLTFQWDQMDRFGFTPYPHVQMPPGEREKGLEAVRQQYAATLTHFRIGAMSERAIRDLVNRCRDEQVPVAFYLMPESPQFQSWSTDEVTAKVAAFRTTLTHELGVPVFDAADGFAEDEFADGHHLLRHGAARFSTRLAVEHVLPWVVWSARGASG